MSVFTFTIESNPSSFFSVGLVDIFFSFLLVLDQSYRAETATFLPPGFPASYRLAGFQGYA